MGNVTLNLVGQAKSNIFAFEASALVNATGFRECDARWWLRYPGSEKEPELNLMGMQALGMGLGFDDGDDRCCDVDGGSEIFADKASVMLARDIFALDPKSAFVEDVTSTELSMPDPALAQRGAMGNHWKTGHSCIKRPAAELHAMALRRNPEVGVYDQTS